MPRKTLPQHRRTNLADHVEIDPERFRRVALIQEPGLQVLHLTLAPGQGVPRHNHPGQHVVLHGLVGTIALHFDDGATTLEPGDLLDFSGERYVAPRNDGDEPAAMLITLAQRPR